MAVRPTLRFFLRAACFTVVCSPTVRVTKTCSAQTAPPHKPACTTNCPPDTHPPSAAEQFPFPGESTQPPAPPTDPEAPTPSTPKVDPNKQYPFPEDASSGSSSSSSAAPDATSAPDDESPDTPKSTRRKLPKVKQLQSPEEREAEDLTVARFYRDSGNIVGSYLRSKDAVKLQPDDPEAHLLLAEAARKLNKRDEAVAEFNTLLKLDASPEQLKTAHKALAQLQ